MNVDALVVSTPANIRYLSGFKGSTAWLFVTPRGVRIVTDGRYRAAVDRGVADGDLLQMSLDLVESGYDAALSAVIRQAGSARVAFESGHVTVAGLARWQAACPGVEWVPADDLDRQRERTQRFDAL